MQFKRIFSLFPTNYLFPFYVLNELFPLISKLLLLFMIQMPDLNVR